MSDKCYSRNGEEYTDLDSVMDDLSCDYKGGEEVEIFEADSDLATHEELFTVDWLIDNMMERAYDEYGEWGESYLDDLGKAKTEDLKKHILKWFDDNAKKPSFYRVTNEKEIKVTVSIDEDLGNDIDLAN